MKTVLVKDGTFSLPGKKALLASNIEYEVVQIDATESPIECPRKRQQSWYSSKKKRHTRHRKQVTHEIKKRASLESIVYMQYHRCIYIAAFV